MKCPHCDTEFTATYIKQKFCTPACGNRARQAKWARRNKPEGLGVRIQLQMPNESKSAAKQRRRAQAIELLKQYGNVSRVAEEMKVTPSCIYKLVPKDIMQRAIIPLEIAN
jgi:hypothetical protein